MGSGGGGFFGHSCLFEVPCQRKVVTKVPWLKFSQRVPELLSKLSKGGGRALLD